MTHLIRHTLEVRLCHGRNLNPLILVSGCVGPSRPSDDPAQGFNVFVFELEEIFQEGEILSVDIYNFSSCLETEAHSLQHVPNADCVRHDSWLNCLMGSNGE